MVSPTPRLRETLTGTCRPRRGLFGRVVMEVQVKIESLEPWGQTPPMPPRRAGTPEQIAKDAKRYEADCKLYQTESHVYPVKATWYVWRDAKMSDFVLKTPEATVLSLEQ